ncbi:sugar-binding domain-containing protein [Parabacteroides timonensis]|uniref:sugar-binding domain-containing protein n=1 Tax=Parabacteroides timonensis TaxID=1871013 RepID=UPI00094E7CB9|nr:sugar-binding domain-containing protein [Parabacteroides timonensis]
MLKQFLFVCISLMAFSACRETSPVISLAGEWQFAMDSTDVGVSEKWFARSFDDKIQLPGTTDEAGYGVPNALLPSIGKPQILHLTRKNSYVGPAWYSREVTIPSDWKDKSIELKLERVIWQTRVWVDGNPVSGSCESLISPHVFDLTEYLTPGKHKLTVRVDNRKQHDISVNDMAHAYTNETQIMWNGIIGEISLMAKEALSIEDLQVYPDVFGKQVHVKGKISNRGETTKGILQAVVQKQKNNPITTVTRDMEFPSGETLLDITCPMGDSMEVWNEFTPTLYQLDLKVEAGSVKAGRSTKFGMREFRHNQSDLLLNGNKAFLRGTLECCIFPLTGRPPMEPEGWKKVFLTAREWGLNHLRFHSWCPPEAAFQVADSLGFYLQVELPLWSLKVGQDQKTNEYLYAEADRILSEYGNHPSFCFLSLGNELQPDFNFLSQLLSYVKEKDPRHLYTTTSFTFERGHGDWPEPNDDFFITQWTKKGWVRGQGVFDTESPSFDKDYVASVEGMTVPLITHEVGQYSVYPNLKEIEKYTGVLDPLNFKGVKQELEKKGLLDKADDYLKASGYLAAILYKEEIERAMKTAGCSGFQLLDLHDFPGQSTALVGLLDAFWDSKGVTDAETFRQASSPVSPLVRFPKAVYTTNESFVAAVEIANFTDKELKDQSVSWLLKDDKGKVVNKGIITCPSLAIGLNKLPETIDSPLDQSAATRLTLSVVLDNTPYKNEWSIWVYPARLDLDKGDIVVTRDKNEAGKALAGGKKVLYNPDYKKTVGLEGKFVPVFWSPVHFPKQAGSMGILCDAGHPAFGNFPTGNYTDWQWWSLLKQSKTVVLDSLPAVTPLIEVVDNFANNRRLSNLFETKVGEGKLIFCSMDLLSDWAQRPEARQLYFSLLEYMKSDAFNPSSAMESSVLSRLHTDKTYSGAMKPEDIY